MTRIALLAVTAAILQAAAVMGVLWSSESAAGTRPVAAQTPSPSSPPAATPSPTAPAPSPSGSAAPNSTDCSGPGAQLSYCQKPKSDGGGWWPFDNPVKAGLKSTFSAFLDYLASETMNAAIETIKWLSSWWVTVDSPSLTDQASPIGFVRTSTHWLVGFTVVLGLLFAAARTAWERRGEPLRQAAAGLLTLIMVSGISIAGVDLAVRAGDIYSEAIWNASTADVESSAKVVLTGGFVGQLGNPVIIILLSTLMLVSCLIQFGMMMLRSVMVIVLAGMLPVAAAASITTEGRSWLRRLAGWLLAYLLYDPVAATLYAVAFKMMASNEVVPAVQGIIMIIMAVMALPALMRFIAPMTSAATGQGGGAAALAGLATMAARGGFGGSPSGAQQVSPTNDGDNDVEDGGGGGGDGGRSTLADQNQVAEHIENAVEETQPPPPADRTDATHPVQETGTSGASPTGTPHGTEGESVDSRPGHGETAGVAGNLPGSPLTAFTVDGIRDTHARLNDAVDNGTEDGGLPRGSR